MAQMALRTKLDQARVYWRIVLAGEGVLWTFAVLLAALLFCFHLDRWLVLSVEARVGAWAVLGILFAVPGILIVLRPLLQPRAAEEIAVMVEREYPQLRERLLSAVEFEELPLDRLQGISPALLEDLRAEADREASGLNFRAAFKPVGMARAGSVFGGVLALVVLHLVFAGPAFSAFLSRMALNNTPVWRDTRVQVSPLRGKVLRGSDLTVGIGQEGKKVRWARLNFQFGNGRWNRVDLKTAPGQDFAHRFASVTESLTYFATAGDGQSDTGQVQVVDPASIVGARIRLDYPAYMDRAPVTTTAPSGGVAAPVGTRVHLELKANKPLETAMAAVGKSPAAPWTVRNDAVLGELTVRDTSSYTLALKDQDGFDAPEKQTFPIKAIPDQTPEVQLLNPAGDLEVAPDARIKLSILARDDYGIDQVRLPYVVEGRKPEQLPAGKGGKKTKSLELVNEWSLAPLKLKPGSAIRYRVEATDFDNINGPHVGRTGELQIRIIDAGEAERRYEEERAELMKQLAELIKEQKGAKADVEKQRAAAKPNPEAIAAAEDRQRTAAATAQDLARRIGELNRAAEMNNLASKAELDSQRAGQTTLDRLSREAMPRAANRIGATQSQAQNDPRGARSELGQAAQQQQQILEELKKVARQMKPASEIQRLAERFERLAQQQRALQAQTEKLLPNTIGKQMSELSPQQRRQLQQLSQQQSSLQRATQQAMQDLEKAGRSMQSRSREQAEAAQQASEGLKQQQTTENQQQAAQNAQQNALGQARSQQDQAAQSLEQAAQQLRAAQNPEDPRSLERQLQQQAQRLNRMMQQQQQAMEQTRKLQSPQDRKQVEQREKELQRLAQQMQRQLQRLQRRSPQAGKASQSMQKAQQSLGQAGQSLSQSQDQQAGEQEQQAQQAMQQAMESLQQAMADAKQQDDPFAPLRKELTRLAAEQKAVHQATQRAEQEQQSGAKPDPAELKELSKKQQAVESATRKLEPDLPGDLFKSYSEQARGSMSKARGALDQGNTRVDPTQQSEARAAKILEQLARALDADPKDTEKQQGGGGQGQGGGGGQADPDLLKRIAEIRLLRAIEQDIRGRTQDLDRARQDGKELTEEQKADIDENGRQQGNAKSFAQKIAEALAKYRSLAGKVEQAGKHMGEAQRGLGQRDTGDGTQEQEGQAIIRLSDALRSAQQQAQQQQQQSQQQQRQRQARRQGKPQGGRQQQGNQPAMQSLARKAGRQDGSLGQYGEDARGFRGLDPRAQDALRQGFKEKTPAEYQDLVNRYYRALSNSSR